MPAFFATVWDPSDEAAAEAASKAMSTTPKTGGATHYCCTAGLFLIDLDDDNSHRTILKIAESGAIYGTLFRRSASLSPSSAIQELSVADQTTIRTSSGAALYTDYWGSYVAFIRTRDGLRVISDPTSSLPCFYFRHHSITCVFSHLELCPPWTRKGREVNQEFITRLLAYDKIQSGQTGLRGIFELRSGNWLSIGASDADEVLGWDPRAFARASDRKVHADVADELKQMIRYVVLSRAMSASRIVLNLSGGLDSAIVSAFLRGLPEGEWPHCVHFSLKGGDPSEAAYARTIASFQGFDLTELAVHPTDALPAPHQCPLSVRPFREFAGLNQLTRPEISSLTLGRTIFTGQGGDHLFLETRSALGFADHVLDMGFGTETISELFNAARLSRKSIWDVLRSALSTVVRGRDNKTGIAATFEARQVATSCRHERGSEPAALVPVWALEPQGVLPGKFSQVESLVHMFQNRNGLHVPGTSPQVHPLISQPLVEFCLRIPVSTLCADGIPRGLARLATRDLVPQEVLRRRSKGDASRFFIEQISANRSLLAETLIDGELVRGGYVDARTMETFLDSRNFRLLTFGNIILGWYAIECWLRRWNSV